MSAESSIHAVAVALAVDPDGPLVGILILGEAGSGKSSFALTLIETCPYQRTALVADDVVVISSKQAGLIASAPAPICGLIEIRGYGPFPIRKASAVSLRFAVENASPPERVSLPRDFRPPGRPGDGIPLYSIPWETGQHLAALRLRRLVASNLGGQLLQCTQDSVPKTAKDGG